MKCSRISKETEKGQESTVLPAPRNWRACCATPSWFSSAARSEFSLTNMIGGKICAAKDRSKIIIAALLFALKESTLKAPTENVLWCCCQ